MSLVKWTFIGLLALPAAEISVFLLVAWAIGWFLAFALFIATSAIGVMLLRQSGINHLIRLRDALARDGLAAVHLETPGFASVVGGILLVFPGFITDLLGAGLFIPPLRRWVGARLGRAIRKRRRRSRDPSVIDLEPDEWQQISDPSQERNRAGRPRARKSRRQP